MRGHRVCAIVVAVLLVGGLGLVANAADASREPAHTPNYSNDFQYPAPPTRAASRAVLLQESFEAGVPPTGWTIVDNEVGGSATTWTTNTAFSEGNYTGGTGECAMACSDCNAGEFNVELRTPVIDCSAASNLNLDFVVNYQNYGFLDYFAVDVSNDGGTSWVNVLSWNEDHGGFYGTPGEPVSLDISSIADGHANVIVRFHYWDPNTSDYDWYIQVDDVMLWEYVSRAGIPTLSPGGIALMLLLLSGVAVLILRRRS